MDKTSKEHPGKTIIAIILVIILLGLSLFVCSCGLKFFEPPSAEEVDQFVEKHKEEIESVNDYLLELGDLDASISHKDGSILVELEHQKIENETVRKAIRTLWRNGCIWITKYTSDNAITYTIWKRTYDEAEGGFVYAIDLTKLPDVQFRTELTPLSQAGWYYYLAEYNKWRAGEISEDPPLPDGVQER